MQLQPRAAAGALPVAHEVDELVDELLALPEREGVEERRHRLRFEGGRAAAEDDRVVVGAVGAVDRDAAEFEQVEDVREAHLVGQRDAEHVELVERVARLQRAQRLVVLAQQVLEVRPRREDALGEGVLATVDDVVEDAESEVRHAEVVEVRVGKRDAHLGRVGPVPGLGDRVQFAAGVARRSLDAVDEIVVGGGHGAGLAGLSRVRG